jgi:zinc and cadmium transporter
MILWSLLSVTAVSLVSLIGVLSLSLTEARVRRLALVFVSFAVGALLGDAFIHLIPEIFAHSLSAASLRNSLLILGGLFLFFAVEKLLRHRHHLIHLHRHAEEDRCARPELAAVNIIGDAIHNFVDGLLIGASYLASPTLGISTTVAVMLHEIPQELGDFGILIHSGLPVKRAVLLNVGSASVAILGTIMALAAGTVAQETVTSTLIPITAGGFVYLAATDLIPELQHDRSLRGFGFQTMLIALGVSVMGLLTLLD